MHAYDHPGDVNNEQPEPPRLLAIHYCESLQRWTPLTGTVQIPALMYEITETTEEVGSEVRTVYEGRIFDAATGEIVHERPYQSTFIEAFARWWTRETELEPPEELLSRTWHPINDHNDCTDGLIDERTGE